MDVAEFSKRKRKPAVKNMQSIIDEGIEKEKTALEELFENDSDENANSDHDIEHELNLYHSYLKIPILEDPLMWWKNISKFGRYNEKICIHSR